MNCENEGQDWMSKEVEVLTWSLRRCLRGKKRVRGWVGNVLPRYFGKYQVYTGVL